MEIKTTEEISVTPYEEVSGIKWVRVDDEINEIERLEKLKLSSKAILESIKYDLKELSEVSKK